MIPINRPDISPLDLETYFQLKFSKFESGKYIKNLESDFANLFGEDYYALFTASAKLSLYLLLNVLNLKGNIITSPLTCYSALNPIIATNNTPHYIDINKNSFLLDENLVEKYISKNDKAIMAISLGGCASDLEKLRIIADKHKIILIEDCAQALGSKYNNKLLGSFGHFAFFSFTKHLSLVGGGMLISKNKSVINQIREIQNQLDEIPKELLEYRFERDFVESKLGIKDVNEFYTKKFLQKKQDYKENNPVDIFNAKHVMCKPNDLQAGMILKQLERLNNIVENRRKNRDLIADKLSTNKKIIFQADLGKSSFAKLYITTPYENKEVITKLVNLGIDAKQLTKSHGIYFQESIDKTKYLFDDSIHKCTNYLMLHDKIVELPLSSKMNTNEIQYITSSINKLIS
ncbi:MAG: DegT/DnrJ/EryC1/StrS family aminotransferase [Bacteroidales bacterium]|jgi:dTDP-4-amino-4,6-dideoxygalactose transaminase|nr:DegT/DnrJ/EryC1/StrS family aminotransferase [Bacteroidales bacterium]OQC44471.1 MAG: UDP-4-amino-4-deoxy-L-arabinose--oxoglutarate aminotransferase [Bacteroidetes bacterium ADurb.Bin028]HOD89421.1 DegT/DnrJ/EryC1/StrS family aminotransferase [Bacteroidales bacterium]